MPNDLSRARLRRNIDTAHSSGARQKNSSWMLSGSRKVRIALRVYEGSLIPEWATPRASRSSAQSSRSVLLATRNSRWSRPRPELVERFPRTIPVFNQAYLKSRARLYEDGVSLAAIRRFIFSSNRGAEELLIPGNTARQIRDGKSRRHVPRYGWHNIDSANRMSRPDVRPTNQRHKRLTRRTAGLSRAQSEGISSSTRKSSAV